MKKFVTEFWVGPLGDRRFWLRCHQEAEKVDVFRRRHGIYLTSMPDGEYVGPNLEFEEEILVITRELI